ncbi:glycoside hydrolase superfamily, partial [Syncephalastrum racemosum]
LFDQFDKSDNVVDEYGLCKKLGPEKARRQLQSHYETFIQEEDFKKLAEMGFNHIRIPTGHWAVDVDKDEPYVPYLSWQYLLRGIQWARKYGLRVMVELHTAPGSQNGWNHSGRYGSVGWLNGTDGEANAERTLKIIDTMVSFFNKTEWDHVVPVFGVINEPAIFRIETKRVQDWYRKSYKAIRERNKDIWLTYHDGFIGLNSWNKFFTDFSHTVLETHMYMIFDDGLVQMPRAKQAAFPCHDWRNTLDQSHSGASTMVGEFSLATNDCGKYLNGVGLGTRYEGTLEGSSPGCDTCNCSSVVDWRNWSDDYKKFLKSFVEHQMDAFERSSIGWFFWTYKTEDHVNAHWDYQLGWEEGWLPKKVYDRQHSCS